VAHRELFEGNGRLARFLSENGAVPHDHPQLFPMLAAEILRGRKVVIFPEGRLVRDRRVMDAEGHLGIFSDRDKVFRPLHRGGGALGVVVDMLKTRLRQLDADATRAEFESWARGLELSPEALRAAILKPTVLVPATITYFPIRTVDNFMSKIARLVSRTMPRAVLNEMILQGNMLLRNTDMDILLGQGIDVARQMPLWQSLLLERGLGGIDTVEKLFALKDDPQGWSERLLAQVVERATDAVRDLYMERIYAGIMVNQSHLAASLLMELLKRGRMRVEKAYFHRALYLAVKAIQNSEGLHLHRSLLEPGRYRGVLDGTNPDFMVFVDACARAGLLAVTRDHYVLSHKLTDEVDFMKDRLANLVRLYANEAMPLPGVREVVATALEEAADVNARTLARLLFDDERRSYLARKAFFAKPRFKDINDKESIGQSGNAGEPYLLMPSRLVPARNLAVVLVHGFRASPAQLRGFGEKLAANGYLVVGVRLAGHGTSPWDLHRRTWGEWVESLARGFRIARMLSGRVALVGFSTGAALSLYYAAQKPEGLAGVVSVAAPLAVRDRNVSLVPWVSKLNRLVSGITGNDGVVPFYKNEPDEPEVSYRALPVQAVQQLVELMAALKGELPKLAAPTLVMQADRDPVVSAESAERIYGLLGSTDKALKVVPATVHGILNGNVGVTQETVLGFLKKLANENKGDA
jgi:esterase/lipase